MQKALWRDGGRGGRVSGRGRRGGEETGGRVSDGIRGREQERMSKRIGSHSGGERGRRNK